MSDASQIKSSSPASSEGSEEAVTGIYSRLVRFLEGRLFPKHAATNLAIMRIIIGGYSAWFLWRYQRSLLRTCTETSHEFFRPVGAAKILVNPLDDQLFVMLFYLCCVACGLFILGLFFRVVGPLFGLLFLFVVTYRQSWGFIYHTENLLVLHIAVLGFAPSAQALSSDAALFKAKPKLWEFLGMEKDRSPSWKFGWPVQLMIFVTGIAYWVAGMAKLGRSGFSWVGDAQLLDHIGNNALRYHLFADGASDFTYMAYAWPVWIWPLLALTSLLLELSAPLAILNDKLAVLFAVGLCCFHWGVLKMMGIPFMYPLSGVAYACFIRWDKVFEFATRYYARLVPEEGAASG